MRSASVSFIVALLSVLLIVPAAHARTDEVRREGSCDLGSSWRLIARRESPSTLRVRYVLDTGRAGQTWSVFLSMNGDRLAFEKRITSSEGYIRVTRFPKDRAGDDLIKGSANNLATGESCGGSLTYRY